ncbi:hypothetical protein TWF481_011551 [Arthrobotrys musiformis]|uniref:SET domain-containing protein n=1 Tax=Arthrobotrys musiformis TaxID=47236 RepID=A0AAV9W145_9PEZI
MAPSTGLIYVLRGQGASYYPSIIVKALIFLRLRKIISNLSETRPNLSWILYILAILFNLARFAESLRGLSTPKNRSKHQVDSGTNNKDNSSSSQTSSDLSIISQILWGIIWPTMAANPCPPTDIERRIYKIKREINSSAIGHLDRAVDRMAVAFSPNTRFADLDFNGPAATAAEHSHPGGQIMHYHANTNIQALPSSTPIPALHMHPDNRHMFRYFAGIPESMADKNYPASIYNIRTQFPPYSPSTGRNLEPTATRSLTVGERFFGHCLVVKAVLPPKHLDATHVLIEDEAGKWELLHIFNFPYTNHVEDRIGQGQLMVIKEPVYYVGYGGFPAVRVDHPSDIMYIMYNHPLVPPKWQRKDAHGLDAESTVLRTDGELRIRWKKYHQAVDCLTLAHDISERTYQEASKNFSRPSSSGTYVQNKLEILKLRTSCYYFLKQWEKCVADANVAMNISFNERTALYKANALLHMNMFDEARQTILRILGASRFKFQDCTSLHSQVRSRYSNCVGRYNMSHILERCKEGQHEISAGDFTAGVRVRKSLDVSGHGLFAQKDFKAGDLVMAIKAVATSHGKDNVTIQVKDQRGELVKDKYGQSMVAQIINRMTAEPKAVGHLIQKLNRENFDATFFKHNGEYLLNGFWIEDTVEKYSMQHTIHNKRIPDIGGIIDPHIFPGVTPEARGPSPVNSVRFALGGGSKASVNGTAASRDALNDTEQVSFFPQAAFINHSCIPNVRISIFSNILFVHAASYIHKEEELLVNYLDDQYSPHVQRRDILKEQYGFSCRCIRCQFEDDNSEYCSTRKRVHEAINELVSGKYAHSPTNILQGVGHCIKTIEQGFIDSPSDIPQFDMAWALMVEEHVRRSVDHDEERTGRTAELKNLKLALRILKALGAEFEFIQGDVRIFRYGFICKWLVEAWILAALSSARFYGSVFWTLRVIAKDSYGILCGETVTFEKLFWKRLEEAEVAELTEEEMLSMADLVDWLEKEGLAKTELV